MIQDLKKVIKEYIDRQEIAGVSVLVQKGEEELCFLAEGMADIENQKKLERDTIYRLYSQTKPITAVAVMILVERGLIDLYQPVSDFLPGYKNQQVWENGKLRPVKREATLFDLMQMTSGANYGEDCTESGRQAEKMFAEVEARLYGDNPMTTIEVANAIGRCALDFDPGAAWNYGTCADVLGAIIEIVTGMRFGEFLEKEIFKPLGMTDTAFWVPDEKKHRLSKTYEKITDETGAHLVLYKESHSGIQSGMERNPAYEAGGAGLASTLDDYLKFARMLRNGGALNGVRILREESVKYLTQGQLMEWQQPVFEEKFGLLGYSYGNLMRVCKNPSQSAMLTRKGEYGWDGWLGMYFVNFPEEDMTILVGMQRKAIGMWPLTRKIRNIILSSV